MEFTMQEQKRLDVALASQENIASRSAAQKLIESGAVRVNGTTVKKTASVVGIGDRISVAEIHATALQDPRITPLDLRIDVLYEDDACLVLNKPAGIAVHPATSMQEGETTLLNGAAFLFQQRGIPFSPDAVLVHRLDKETTGCLLIAKSDAAHAVLQKQFEERTVRKTYLALVAGIPDPPSAVIDAPVGRNLLNRMKMSVLRTSKSREAKTTYRTLGTAEDCALLACDLHTGRTHQIRVHLHAIGHPILGDATYCSHASEQLTARHHIEHLCLHAWTLAFVSPGTRKIQEITAAVPDAFHASLEVVGLTPPAASPAD